MSSPRSGSRFGNTLEAVVGVWLLQQIANGIRAFDHAYDVFRFALALAISTVISATIGVTSLALCGFCGIGRITARSG